MNGDDPSVAFAPDRRAPGAAESAGSSARQPSPLDVLDALVAQDGAEPLAARPIDSPAVAVALRDPESGARADDDEPRPSYQTILRQPVLDQIREHGEGESEVEVCGVLVGSVYENSSGAFTYVEGCIRGSYAAGRSAQVTFTAETWQHIDREMDEKFPGRKIVGWYHTHPGFGIFLSEMDLFIQRHFFNAPWQTAFVYDPQSQQRGLFGWEGTEIVRQNFVVDSEGGPAVKELAGPNLSPRAQFGEEAHPGAESAGTTDLSERIKALEQRQRYMIVAIVLLVLAVFIWPLVVQMVMTSPDAATPPGGGGAPAPQGSVDQGNAAPADPAGPTAGVSVESAEDR